jgi:hypothetical protein
MNDAAKTVFWFGLLLLIGMIGRWLPHPPNFSPMLAVALFAGLVLPGPLALLLPVICSFATDLILGFHDQIWSVYISLLLLVFLGAMTKLGEKPMRAWAKIAGLGLFGSVLFFFTTNLAVWWFSGIYPHTKEGLITCFVLALPFFHNSVGSTLLYIFTIEFLRRNLPEGVRRPVKQRA